MYPNPLQHSSALERDVIPEDSASTLEAAVNRTAIIRIDQKDGRHILPLLAAFFNSVFLLALGLAIFLQGLENGSDAEKHSEGTALSMKAVLLHVAADALNNLAVIISAVIIWKVPSHNSLESRPHHDMEHNHFGAPHPKYYADPACTVFIAILIMASTGPVVLQSGKGLIAAATNTSIKEVMVESPKGEGETKHEHEHEHGHGHDHGHGHESSPGNNVVVKLRKDAAQPAEFQKEVSQCQRFKGATHIRQLLDVIKDETPGEDFDHGMVLEWLPGTLWDARESGRLAEFGLAGIRKIMRDTLEGIEELHAKDIIHLDIKAQNILLNGTSAKLFDLGSTWAASPPSTGVAQPMPYRSPEILFGLQWSKEVDIWGWAMVYLHMIQAYLRPDIWGLYDRLPDESAADATQRYEERVRVDLFHDFRLYDIPFFEQCKDRWPELDPEREEVTLRAILEHLQFPEEDIHLLETVMIPDPKARPTATDILRISFYK
ncbi:uncharacterized protein GIQ15_05331 [Arthroderma uncinatum]|uniref:uncharacterized protein n=1 Tax=Arthroderma uncinatum TaxID=74035 RepID=UPI00144AA918|nr:uncharacterized protein GIQ15_05331 [Arthroderma uncinatum]KAF3482572.1 hypothetical protein GIQ15_05331 [Arthroderma uncinatum]